MIEERKLRVVYTIPSQSGQGNAGLKNSSAEEVCALFRTFYGHISYLSFFLFILLLIAVFYCSFA